MAHIVERTRYLKKTPKGETQMSKIVEEYAERLAERMLERHRKEIEAEAEAKAEALAEAKVRKVREAHKKSFLDSIASLMKTMGLTTEQAMDALSIPAENQAYYLEALKEQAL